MKTFKNKKTKLFILLCFSFCFANASVLKGDSLESNYDIKDPRNPNCPCHKYQKLADDEFRKLLGKEVKINPDNTNSNYTNSFNGNNELNSKNTNSTKKFRSKKWAHSFFNLKKKKGAKKRKVRRLRRDNTTCFHF